MGEKKKGYFKVRGLILQFTTAFGLTFSVTVGFYLGYVVGKRYEVQSYTGVLGALVGFVLGLAGLIWLANGQDNGVKR